MSAMNRWSDVVEAEIKASVGEVINAPTCLGWARDASAYDKIFIDYGYTVVKTKSTLLLLRKNGEYFIASYRRRQSRGIKGLEFRVTPIAQLSESAQGEVTRYMRGLTSHEEPRTQVLGFYSEASHVMASLCRRGGAVVKLDGAKVSLTAQRVRRRVNGVTVVTREKVYTLSTRELDEPLRGSLNEVANQLATLLEAGAVVEY